MKVVVVADVKEVTASVLLYDFDGFLSHIKVFHPFGACLCVWCETVVKFHSSVYGCTIFPVQFIEETVFFPLDVSSCFVKDHRVKGPFLESLFCSIGLCACFCASTMLSL